MRISEDEIQLLKSKLYELSHSAKIYLFGSRIDDTKKGGDIDLLVLDDFLNQKDIRRLRVEFFKKFGEQKIDIVLDKINPTNPFSKYVFQKAIKL
jgi:predicted nucleotidyltransferase